jgi:hypothetical protein
LRVVYYERNLNLHKEVKMNRYSVKVDPRHGTSFARVWNRDNAASFSDADWIAEVGSALLAGTHIPPQYHRETAEVIARLVSEEHLVDVIIYDAPDGWCANVTICPELENIYLRGFGATPAEAISNAQELPWFWARWVD